MAMWLCGDVTIMVMVMLTVITSCGMGMTMGTDGAVWVRWQWCGSGGRRTSGPRPSGWSKHSQASASSSAQLVPTQTPSESSPPSALCLVSSALLLHLLGVLLLPYSWKQLEYSCFQLEV
eukprot:1061564-Rhodomonas_salina.1